MAMNKIQFQAGMSMQEFHRQYGTEEQCEATVFASRWPGGWSCPRCQSTRHACTHNGRKLWECLSCGYQCSSIVGTLFEHTKLSLTIWFLAMYLMTQSKNAVESVVTLNFSFCLQRKFNFLRSARTRYGVICTP